MYSLPSHRREWLCKGNMAFVLYVQVCNHKVCPCVASICSGTDGLGSVKDLYNSYTEIFRSLRLPAVKPPFSAERYNKDFGMKGFFLSQHLVPSNPFRIEGSNLDLLATEIEAHETSIRQSWLPKEERITRWIEEALKRMMAGDVTAFGQNGFSARLRKQKAGPAPSQRSGEELHRFLPNSRL